MTEANIRIPEPPADASAALGAVEQYVAFWNAAADDERRRLAAATFSDRVTYHAPAGLMRGVDAMVGFRNEFAQHFPDYVLRPRTEPQAHHGRARLQWELVVGGESFATGTDVLEFDDHDQVVAVATFLDRAPAHFAHPDH